MAVTNITYGTHAHMTVTNLHSLANDGFWQSAAVDNSSTKADDAFVHVILKSHVDATPTDPKCCYVYVYGSPDGTSYPDAVSGSQGTLTPTNSANLILLGAIGMTAQDTTYSKNLGSVAAAFGGILPTKWGIVIENQTGDTLHDDTNDVIYDEITYTTA